MRAALIVLACLASAPFAWANTGTDVCGEGILADITLSGSLSCSGSLTQSGRSAAHFYRAASLPGDLLWLNVSPDAALVLTHACIHDQGFSMAVCDASSPTHRVAVQVVNAMEVRMFVRAEPRPTTVVAPYGLEFVRRPPAFAVQEESGTIGPGLPLHVDDEAFPLTGQTFVPLAAPMRPRQELVVSWEGDALAERSFFFEVGNHTDGWRNEPMDCVATAPRERTCHVEGWAIDPAAPRPDQLRLAVDAGLEARWRVRYTYWEDAGTPLS